MRGKGDNAPECRKVVNRIQENKEQDWAKKNPEQPHKLETGPEEN